MGGTKNDKDATRQERKAKKRKLEDIIPDLPGDENKLPSEAPAKKSKRRAAVDEYEIGEERVAVAADKTERNKKRKSKRNVEKDDSEAVALPDGSRKDQKTRIDGDEIDEEVTDTPRKSKKERKAERKAAKAAAAAIEERSNGLVEEEQKSEPDIKAAAVEEEPKKARKNNRNREKRRKLAANVANGEEAPESKVPRFILFIGNLPYTATTESVQKHFASVHPISVRHLTKKEDPSKSKGCAFLEFEGYDHMKTCLKLLHHSEFDDGNSPPRKINVELTAGGGGNTKHRKQKIGEKNGKLKEQRIRRMQEEEKAKILKREVTGGAIDQEAVHPSRRGRVPEIS